jgi:hypothetical protein
LTPAYDNLASISRIDGDGWFIGCVAQHIASERIDVDLNTSVRTAHYARIASNAVYQAMGMSLGGRVGKRAVRKEPKENRA